MQNQTKALKSVPEKLKKSERPPIPKDAKEQLYDYINLVCIMCRGNQLVFYHNSGETKLIAMNLCDLPFWLNEKMFMLTHESNILNFDFIIDIEPRGKGLWLIMPGNLRCKVTEKLVAEFYYRYDKYKKHKRLMAKKPVMSFHP